MIFLRDYAQFMIENCNFTYVAEADGKVVGLICGNYEKKFNKSLSKKYDYRRHPFLIFKFFFKYIFGFYHLSKDFKEEFKIFFEKLRQRKSDTLGECDCELAALTTRKEYRKGLGTALVSRFEEHCLKNNVKTIRVLTNTASKYEFYDKYGFYLVKEIPYEIKQIQGKTMIYEIKTKMSDEKRL